MTEAVERRRAADQDIRALVEQMGSMTKVMADNHLETVREISKIGTTLEVHIAEDRAVSDRVREHSRKIDDFERLKNKGLLYIFLGWLASGAAGGGIAHIARKFLE